MIQCYDNTIQLADFLLQFGISINSNNISNIEEIPDNYGLIKISGDDAANFLQKQLACNISQTSETPTLGAICNIQGRVEAVFKIYKLNNNFYMQIIKELLTPTINNLSKYILRSKVILNQINQDFVQQSKQAINKTTNKYNNILWKVQQIAQKIPEIYLTTTGKFLPHNINLIKLNAVSLNKGCYKGQSIITRMECLGKIKKELKIISINNTEQILIPGDKLNNQATVVRSVALDNKCQLVLIEATLS